MPALKANPRVINTGFRDDSRQPITIVPEALPQHLPLIHLLTQRGPLTPQVVVGDGFNQMYGADSLELLKQFATHQTVLAKTIMARSNKIMVKRVELPGMATALLRFAVELIPYQKPVYARNADGTYQIGSDGLPIWVNAGEEQDGDTVIGRRLVWHKNVSDAPPVQDGGEGDPEEPTYIFGNASVVTDYRPATTQAGGESLSTLTLGGQPAASVLYPIFDLELNDPGSWGDNVGLSVGAPNSQDVLPGDVPAMEEIRAYLYNFIVKQRDSAVSTANTVYTVEGEQGQDLSFKAGVVNPKTGFSVNIEKKLVSAYQSLDDASVQPLYGPFGRLYVYKDNLDTVLTKLGSGTETGYFLGGQPAPVQAEGYYDADAEVYGRHLDVQFQDRPDNFQLLNIFTGLDQNGVPYYSFDVADSVKFGGIAFGPGNVHYATGGSDGLAFQPDGRPDTLTNLRLYDEAVRNELSKFGQLATKWLDYAKYPFSNLWDSGYSLNTKKAMLVAMSRRQDTYVVLATHAVAEYDNPSDPQANEWRLQNQYTGTVESDMAALLNAAALNYPESTFHGTPCARVAIVGHSGHLLNSTWDGWLPLTIDLADKVANYMGADNGVWRNGAAFNAAAVNADTERNNKVTLFRDINLTYKEPTVYSRNWSDGLIWVQSSDHRGFYYPAFQTVYPDDTSVLNSFPTMQACCTLTKVGNKVHILLSGDDTLTEAQFVERSDELINQLAKPSKFDNRFIIRPETQFTALDTQRSFSWTTLIHIGANGQRTVNTLTVVTHRMSDLVGAQ